MDNYAMQIKKLNDNEQSLFAVMDRISHVSDSYFKRYFPVANNGLRVILRSWGGVVIAPLPLPRENNNCWSIIRQMELWKRYYRLTAPYSYDRKQRFKANITYFSKSSLPVIPNPIEAHPMIDALTTMLGIDDNLKKLDYSIGVEQISQGVESCRIIISQIDRLPYLPEEEKLTYLPSEYESFSETKELLPRLYELSEKDVMLLYHTLINTNSQIRSEFSLEDIAGHSSFRRRHKSNVGNYRDLLKKHSFIFSQPDENGSFHISIDVPFRSREQLASDAFIKELEAFWDDCVQLKFPLNSPVYHLTISQKGSKPDGDNIPFERIISILQKKNRLHLEQRIDISYAPDMTVKTDLCFSPVQ